MAKKKVKYPENLSLKEEIKASGRSVRWYANQTGYSEQVISQTIHGHYKGLNVVPKLQQLLKPQTDDQIN